MLSVVLFMLLGAVGPGQGATQVKETIPQAQPVFLWLKAVKDGDQERLKTCFSDAMRGQFEKEGWDKVMAVYQGVFNKEFGDYRPEDFSFQFQGGESRGTVLISYHGRILPGLQVIKERNEWKVDER